MNVIFVPLTQGDANGVVLLFPTHPLAPSLSPKSYRHLCLNYAIWGPAEDLIGLPTIPSGF